MKEHDHPYWNKANFPHAPEKQLAKASELYHDRKKVGQFYETTHKIKKQHEEKENQRFT